MNILVFNCGSSSLTYKIFEIDDQDNIKTCLSGKAHRIGIKGKEESFIETRYEGKTDKLSRPIRNHKGAAEIILKYLLSFNSHCY